MRFSFFVFFLLCIACGSSTTDEDQKKTNEAVDLIPLKLVSVSVYQLTKHPVTDSLLLPLKAFSEYNQKLNELAKLEPTGIEPFILGTLIKCDVLLKKVLPAPFETPEIKSRLKVVKTQLLKARYFSQKEQVKEFNESIEGVFIAHRSYLKRIEDFAQNADQNLTKDVKDLN